LNFTGQLRDVFTLSHELGHAFHGHLSQEQKAPVYDSPLALAETASIFTEMLLAESLRETLSPLEYQSFLNDRLTDIFATIFRQVQYTLFERTVHEQILSGKDLSYADLGILWRQEQVKLYGQNIRYDVSAEEETTWAQIPHVFHTPFYCYAYAFGNILTFALYHHIQTGQLSTDDYKNILRAGGSVRPKELLGRYGIDISEESFYTGGLDVVADMVRDFEGS